MVSYNFQDEFVSMIENGTKTQTIRAISKKRHVLPGERIQLYENWRTSDARKIIDDPVCLSVELVKLTHEHTSRYHGPRLTIGGTGRSIHIEAAADGFPDDEAFIKFFEDTHGLPFEGVLIKWA